MTRQIHLLITLLSVVLCFLQFTEAEIQNVKIESDDREIMFFGTFGFTTKGYVDLSVSNINISITNINVTKPLNYSRFAFLATPVYGPPFECLLDDPESIPLVIFDENSVSKSSSNGSITKSTPVPIARDRDILFVNCNPETEVSMRINLQIYNLGKNGKKNFLQIGESPLPTLFTLFSIVYICLTISWGVYCFKNKQYCHRIHVVMGILLPIKAVNLIFAAEDKYHVMVTGEERGWGLLFFWSQIIRTILLSTVIILIGAGWSYLKPVLQLKEKATLGIGITLQIVTNVGYMVVLSNIAFESFFDLWFMLCLLGDFVCCCIIMAPLFSSMVELKESATVDGRAQANLQKLRFFRNLYSALLVYFFFTKYLTLYIGSIFDYDLKWVNFFVIEAASLGFYISIYYMVRPQETHQYLAIEDEDGQDSEEVALATIHKEFGDL